MNFTLYYNASERKVVGKSLQNLGNITGVLKGEGSILSPRFILETAGKYLNNCNYLYWQEAGRYYFIDDVVVMTGGRMMVYCTVDVLQSFAAEIREQLVITDKQLTIGSVYIDDGSWVAESREFYSTLNFQNGFNNNGEFILITAGA